MFGETPARPLTGRVAVITGAFGDVGETLAGHLARLGARVALLAGVEDRLDGPVSRIEEDGAALAITVDVTDAAAVRSAAGRVAAELDDADLLFNNADVMLPAPAERLTPEQREHRIDLNITGLMNVLGAFTPQLVRAAAERGVADLINTSSTAALDIFPNIALHSGTRAYVTHLSHHLRVELGTRNVRVSTLEPGIVDTGSRGQATGDNVLPWPKRPRETAEGLTPRDIAETVGFIATLPPRVNLQQVTIMPTHRPG
ncbi:SDR family oxidoreductase [Streptosporangium sp. NPDC002721]|uniref:SDR family oxidoreductase n=1 Tax=Streptosporangium sp. NPDC002721 TaxID=3366188 RepID=UPI0036BC2BCC